MICGYFSSNQNPKQSNNMMELCRNEWDKDLKPKPILNIPNFLIWADEMEDIQFGWRGDCFIVFRGEIFNALVPIPEGSNNDQLNLIALLYVKYGEEFSRHLNGAFSIILYDGQSGNLRLIQSLTPDTSAFSWMSGEWGLAFSNRIWPLLKIDPSIGDMPNPEGLYQLLFRSHILPPQTIYRNIFQIPFGHLLRAESSTLVEYDSWRIPETKVCDEHLALTRYEALLQEALSRHVSRAEDPVFLLSGGFDSSVNVALGNQLIEGKLVTIGIGAKKYNTDAHYARMVAKHIDSDHREYIFDGSEVEKLPGYIRALESPYFEPGMLLTCRALELAKENGHFVIGGEGTDQVFGSCAAAAYSRYRNSTGGTRLVRKMLHSLAHNHFTRSNSFLSRLENRFFGPINCNTWCGAMGFRDSDIRQLVYSQYFTDNGYDSESLEDDNLDSMMRFSCQVLNRDYVYYGILPICGRQSETQGLNTYSPYLDKQVMEFILSLDHSLRTPALNKGLGQFDSKYLHKKLALKLLPPKFFERPKQGGAINPFIHLEDAQRLAAIKRHLTKSDFLQPIIRPKPLNELFNEPRLNSTRIFLLLSLDIWFNLVVKNPVSPNNETPTLSEYLS